jgi:hypothetical protein
VRGRDGHAAPFGPHALVVLVAAAVAARWPGPVRNLVLRMLVDVSVHRAPGVGQL